MSPSVEEFRELSREERDGAWRITISSTASTLTLSVYDVLHSRFPGGDHIFSRTYARPEGVDPQRCLEAALGVLARSQADGLLVPRSERTW